MELREAPGAKGSLLEGLIRHCERNLPFDGRLRRVERASSANAAAASGGVSASSLANTLEELKE